MNKLKVYYAHPITLYGTPAETRDIATLEALGFEVVNPNTPELDAAYKERGMEVFTPVVESCDALAFRSFPDGSIPAGVAQEIKVIHALNRPVIELPHMIGNRILSLENTRCYLAESERQ